MLVVGVVDIYVVGVLSSAEEALVVVGVLVSEEFVVAVHVGSAGEAPGELVGGPFLHDPFVVQVGVDGLGEAHQGGFYFVVGAY